MLDFILRSRVKYVAIGLIALFWIIVFLSSSGDHTQEEQQLGLIQYKKNALAEKADAARRLKEKKAAEDEVKDFQVRFYSGKDAADEVDNEKKAFQVHHVKITNLEKSKVNVECHDPFSSFGKALAPGGTYEFRVTDLFAKRHYWCTAQYGTSEFSFKAYGEGAPRENNNVVVHKDGAYINGKNMKISEDDNPSKYKKPPQRFLQSGARVVHMGATGDDQQDEEPVVEDKNNEVPNESS